MRVHARKTSRLAWRKSPRFPSTDQDWRAELGGQSVEKCKHMWHRCVCSRSCIFHQGPLRDFALRNCLGRTCTRFSSSGHHERSRWRIDHCHNLVHRRSFVRRARGGECRRWTAPCCLCDCQERRGWRKPQDGLLMRRHRLVGCRRIPHQGTTALGQVIFFKWLWVM